MARFEIEWSIPNGIATVEADDTEEAKQILIEGLQNFDTMLFEEVDVNDVTINGIEQLEDG